MANRRVNAHRALASPSRVTLLDALQQREGMSITELAEISGLHPNTAREHLGRLIEAGFVACEPEERHTRGRPRMLYRAVGCPEPGTAPGQDDRTKDALARAELTRILLAGFGTGSSSDAARARSVGEAAAQHPASLLGSPAVTPPEHGHARGEAALDAAERRQLDLLEDHFDQIGFEPILDGETLEVHLNRCPFYDLARQRPEVVCRVHEGLADGVLSRIEGPLEVDGLTPFVGPEHCVMRLRRRPGAACDPLQERPTRDAGVDVASAPGAPAASFS